jgi:hypothetical protein
VSSPPSPLTAAAERLQERAADAGWRGPDPYDGLFWRWPGWMTGGRRRRQAIVQIHARSPIDVRRAYRRSHPRIAKTLALFGAAGLRIHRLTGGEAARTRAIGALEALRTDREAGARAWGYPFDVQTRWSYYAAGTPNVVVTAFAIPALLEGAAAIGREDLAERAREAARWILDELWVEAGGFFAYHPDSRVNVHNANLLGAAAVADALGDDPAVRAIAARAVDRTLARQAPDGSWEYGEGENLGWADSFHTGYVLLSLSRLRAVDPAVDAAIARGARHYERFFDERGRATLWADRPWPEDGHSAGTGLSTLAALAGAGHVEHELLQRVAARTVSAGMRGSRVVARRHRLGPTTVWYPRWCDGHVALGLADAAAELTPAQP